MDIHLSLYFTSDGCMPLSFLDLSWMYALGLSWFMMDKCLSVSLTYHEWVHMSFLYLSVIYAFVVSYLSWMYATVFPSSSMEVFLWASWTYHWCMPNCFLFLSWMYASVSPWSIKNAWRKSFLDLSWIYVLAFPCSTMVACLSVSLMYYGYIS